MQVTKLDYDYSSGTALQEISFWLNLEKALQRIQEKRDSQEVTLTLDILKYAKRFHATVSFDSDTGKHLLTANLFQVNECCNHLEIRLQGSISSYFFHWHAPKAERFMPVLSFISCLSEGDI